MAEKDIVERDKDFAVTFTELEHIQAIIGRYDSFFFLMKQLSLGGVFALLLTSMENGFEGAFFGAFIPGAFFVFELSFRYFYWSNFILRIAEIERYLNGDEIIFRLYDLNRQFPFRERIRLSFQKFDILFYLSIIAALLLISLGIGAAAFQLPLRA